MANGYVRMTKLSNVKGRQDYIMSDKKQENIVLRHNEELDFSPYVDFEKELSKKQGKKINEGRELIFALPNEWAELEEEELRKRCLEISNQSLGKSTDFCFAIHWNESLTNLHMHLIFSERTKEEGLKQATYKRDVWLKKDGTLAKSKSERYEKIHSKGDFKFTKDGLPQYEKNKVNFSNKDTKYKTKAWLHEVKENYRNLLINKYKTKFKEKSPERFTKAEIEMIKRGEIPWKEEIRIAIDKVMEREKPYNFDEFKEYLENRDIWVEIRTPYRLSILDGNGIPKGSTSFCYGLLEEKDGLKFNKPGFYVYDKKLGNNYTLKEICNEFSKSREQGNEVYPESAEFRKTKVFRGGQQGVNIRELGTEGENLRVFGDSLEELRNSIRTEEAIRKSRDDYERRKISRENAEIEKREGESQGNREELGVKRKRSRSYDLEL